MTTRLMRRETLRGVLNFTTLNNRVRRIALRLALFSWHWDEEREHRSSEQRLGTPDLTQERNPHTPRLRRHPLIAKTAERE